MAKKAPECSGGRKARRAARYRKPWPIVLGVLVATAANHALAAALGGWLTAAIGADRMRVAVGVGFIAMAAWAFVC